MIEVSGIKTLCVAAENVNIITLQEVCAGQHTAIRNALGSKWHDSFKNFGSLEACHNRKYGLSIFTKGTHDAAKMVVLQRVAVRKPGGVGPDESALPWC